MKRLTLLATATVITLTLVGIAHATPPEWRKSSDPQMRALAARLDWFDRQFPHPGQVFLERNAGLHPMAGVVHRDHPNRVRAREARQRQKEVTFQPCGSRCASRVAQPPRRSRPMRVPTVSSRPPRPTNVIAISPVISPRRSPR
jgi:hypothetical protein